MIDPSHQFVVDYISRDITAQEASSGARTSAYVFLAMIIFAVSDFWTENIFLSIFTILGLIVTTVLVVLNTMTLRLRLAFYYVKHGKAPQ